jgi:hypothetical protein
MVKKNILTYIKKILNKESGSKHATAFNSTDYHQQEKK